jgi:hypothetical protein
VIVLTPRVLGAVVTAAIINLAATKIAYGSACFEVKIDIAFLSVCLSDSTKKLGPGLLFIVSESLNLHSSEARP